MMVRTLVLAPGSEPISTQEAKDHLCVGDDVGSDDDAKIDAIILAAREYVESVTNRALITQTWDGFLNQFTAVIELPKSPLQSVTSITYVDTNGDSQILATSVYVVDTDSDPGRVYLAYQQSWPSIRGTEHDITIRFVGGYGDSEEIPEQIKQALLLHIQILYEMPDPAYKKILEDTRDSLIALYRVYYAL